MATSAYSRAFCASDRPGRDASSWTMGKKLAGPVSVQNRAVSVCCGVRAVLPFAPSEALSAKSAAHSLLRSAGGGGGRNWAPLAIVQGLTEPHADPTGSAVGMYFPAVVTGRTVFGAEDP